MLWKVKEGEKRSEKINVRLGRWEQELAVYSCFDLFEMLQVYSVQSRTASVRVGKPSRFGEAVGGNFGS